MQFKEFFHTLVCNLQSDQYGLCREHITVIITPKSQVFNNDSMNFAQTQDRRPPGETAPKTAQFTYRSWQNTIWTPLRNWSQNAGPAAARFSGGNQPKSKGPGYSCGKTHDNSSVPVPTRTGNCPRGLEPLLIVMPEYTTQCQLTWNCEMIMQLHFIFTLWGSWQIRREKY